jgi:hypothetical protein
VIASESRLPERAVLWSAAFALFLTSAWLFHLHVVAPAWGTFEGDLRLHLALAAQIERGAAVPVAHRGFHYAIILISRVLGWSLGTSATLLLALATCASFLLTYWLLRELTRDGVERVWLAALALVMSLVGPLYLPFFNRDLYLGQGTPNIWHNPTWVLMQPLALLTVGLWYRSLGHRQPRAAAAWRRAGASIALLASTFVKPSFAVVFLPALAVLAAIRGGSLREKALGFAHLAILAAPTLALLGFEYLRHYAAADSGTRLIVAPFVVWGAKTPSVAISALLTVAFPLVVSIGWPETLREDRGLQVIWIVTAIAFLERALLAESGPQMMHGNWAWGYFIALKLLFVFALAAFLGRAGGPGRVRPRVILAWTVLAFHLAAGLWYLDCLLSGKGFQ